MKEKIRKEYLRTAHLIFKSELSGKNKLHALGNQAVPVTEYSFGIIGWTKAEIQKMDRITSVLHIDEIVRQIVKSDTGRINQTKCIIKETENILKKTPQKFRRHK